MSSLIKRSMIKMLIIMSSLQLIAMPCLSYAYIIYYDYQESDLPQIINFLPSDDPLSPWDEQMAARWNIYADIFAKYSNRLTPYYNDGKSDQKGSVNDDEFKNYFGKSKGMEGALATTVREYNIFAWFPTSHVDIVYNSGYDQNWSTVRNNYYYLPGICLHELGHSIGLYENIGMTIMNVGFGTATGCLFPDDVKYLYDKFPNKSKVVTDMGVWAAYADDANAAQIAIITPNSVNAGDQISINRMYVGNLKNGSQSGTVVKIYLSEDQYISESDTLIGILTAQGSFSAASGGSYDISAHYFTIPQDTPSGTYYVGMIIYADGTSQDAITYNNTDFVWDPIIVTHLTPTPSPTPIPTPTRPVPSSLVANCSFELGTDTNPDNWTKVGTASMISRTSPMAYSGSHCV